jgi:quercetin dioxygenase-like cupin family protein
MRLLLLALIVASFHGCAPATHASSPAPAPAPAPARADPIITDPDNYKMILENDRVRVLRYHDVPGTKTHLHHHPASMLYALSTFKRRLTFGNGKTQAREVREGDVLWLPAQDHLGENIGTTPTEVLLVEVKASTPPP